MKFNLIGKALLLSTALFSVSLAKKVEQQEVIKKSKYSNTATYIGGAIDGIKGNGKCKKVDLGSLKQQYAVVSDHVYSKIEKDCEDRYVVALSTNYKEDTKSKMVKAKIVESSSECDDAQVILNKSTFNKISKDDEKVNVIWAVVDSAGKISLKVNYEGLSVFKDYAQAKQEELVKLFEDSAIKMVKEKIDFQKYPWEDKENIEMDADNKTSVNEIEGDEEEEKEVKEVGEDNGNGVYISGALAVVGLGCFIGYKYKSKKSDVESSLAIPDLPPLDTTINTVSDHPDGLPRVDIYNPPLEFYHFPMDTSYDIVDIRPDFYD
ncbi:hypothetical protein BCR36DRAFT_403628 [Piromyces finnis]|uniref:Uncharacterized protein n=1 Tax=Piromyces finnis TaxID=1754191 RepID=A0A1Y1VEL3_9FUNG|nr:hypothetical protein BCR36DRAFT_403628 [Piromyces finnis]|eukprot:ORX53416.1 hypothetical protein BCR36DRAFT_403628 [Piromyces finnis]